MTGKQSNNENPHVRYGLDIVEIEKLKGVAWQIATEQKNMIEGLPVDVVSFLKAVFETAFDCGVSAGYHVTMIKVKNDLTNMMLELKKRNN